MGPRWEPGGLTRRSLLGLVLLTLLAGPVAALPAAAQEAGAEVNVELILDASGSMAQRIGGETRMTIAKRVLHDVIAAIPEREGVNVGFRLYGHRGDNSAAGKAVSCRSSELLVPIEGVDKAALEDAVDGARATGWTPLATSIRRAIGDFPPAERGVVNAVVLVTDGLETCDGDPCAAAAEAEASDVNLTSHVVSFAQSAEERAILECIAEAGDGLLLGADDADELAAALFRILEELEVVESTGILEIEAFGDVWPAATATCAGRVSDSDPEGDAVTVRFTRTNRAEVPVGACDLAWRNPSGTTTRLRVAIEPGRVTWVRGSLLELPQGAGESYAVADAAGLVVWEAPVEAFDRIWLLPGLYRIELAERVGDPVLIAAEIDAIEGTVIRLSVGTEP
jgi:hypothetical protein